MNSNTLSSFDNLPQQIEYLSLKRNYFRVLPADLVNKERLLFLDLSFNQLSDISVLGQLNFLKVLMLKGNQIAKIASLANIRTLVELDLDTNSIDKMEEVSCFEHHQSIAVLNLQHNPVVEYARVIQQVQVDHQLRQASVLQSACRNQNWPLLKVAVHVLKVAHQEVSQG